MSCDFESCPDADSFQAVLAPWLAIDPARHALICGVARMPGAWRGIVRRGGQPVLDQAQLQWDEAETS